MRTSANAMLEPFNKNLPEYGFVRQISGAMQTTMSCPTRSGS